MKTFKETITYSNKGQIIIVRVFFAKEFNAWNLNKCILFKLQIYYMARTVIFFKPLKVNKLFLHSINF